MAGQIPRDFIDSLLSRIDIVELIDSRVPLKKRGNNYLACCPFHGEKTPSFNVSPNGQFYHCFGCGVSGDALEFLIQFEHLDFVDAVEELADRLGLEVPRIKGKSQSDDKQKKASLYDLMEKVSHYYAQQLTTQQDAPVNAYIQKRGLSEQIIHEYGIGYSPNSWDRILNLLKKETNSQNTLIDTGLIIQPDDKSRLYDRFRDRLMFPIRDRRGRTIGFGGRILTNDKNQAKYLNSPETPLFHKGSELYGFYEMTKALRKIERILVVEGYMDVVALAQYDLRYVVATLGTATTPVHLEKLFRTAPEVVFCFDGDRAGRDAAWKAMDNLLPIIKPGQQGKFMFIEEGEDPDSLIRKKGKPHFEECISNAQPLSDFFYQTLQKQVDIHSYDGRTQLIDLAKPYISKIPTDSAFYLLMKNRLADLAEVSTEDLSVIFNEPRKASHTATTSHFNSESPYAESLNPQKAFRAKVQGASPLTKAITYLLHYPELALVSGDPEYFSDIEAEETKMWIRLLDLFQYDPKINLARLLSIWGNPKEENQLKQIMMEPLLLEDKAAIKKEYLDLLKLFVQKKQQKRIEQLQRIDKQNGLSAKQKREYLQLCRRK